MTRTRNTLWLTACRLTGDVLNLMLFVLISRQFGPAGVGEYAYSFAIATFAFVIGCLGIEEYGLRQYVRLDREKRPAFLGELLGTQSLMVATAVAGLAVYLIVTKPPANTLVMVVALGIYQITAAIVATLFIPAMAEQRMLWPALAELSARAVAFAVAGYSIGVAHSSLPPALLGFPIAAVFWLAIATVANRRFAPQLRFSLSWHGTRRILVILWSFALLEVFAQLFARIGVISLTLGVSDAAAGIFATGLRLIEVALMPLSFLGVAAYPTLSAQYVDDPVAFRRGATDLLWVMLLGGGGVAWGLYFVAPVLLVPVLGARFAGAEPFIQTMAVFALVQAVEVGFGRVLLCADRQVANAAFVAAGAVLSVALNLVLVPRYGVNGAIFSGALAYVGIDILCVAALRKPVAGNILARLLSSLALSIGIGSAVAAGLAWRGLPFLLQAIASLAAFGLLAAALFRYRHGGAAAAIAL